MSENDVLVLDLKGILKITTLTMNYLHDFFKNDYKPYIHSTDEKAFVELPVPGLTKDDLEITFEPDENLMFIKGNPSKEFHAFKAESIDHTLRVNTKMIDTDDVHAHIEDGILTIELKRKESARKVIAIK